MNNDMKDIKAKYGDDIEFLAINPELNNGYSIYTFIYIVSNKAIDITVVYKNNILIKTFEEYIKNFNRINKIHRQIIKKLI